MQVVSVQTELGIDAASSPDALGLADVHTRHRDLCRSLIRERHMINRWMNKRFHANADFAMLLAIYLAEAEGRETYLCEVAQATSIVSSTAHRKLGEMIELGMLLRTRTNADRRRVGLVLSPDMRTKLEALLDRLAGDSK